MPRDHSDAAAMYDMLQAAETAQRYVEGKTRDDLDKDGMRRHALERTVEIIGEAARRLSPEFREAHPDIPWRAIMATRHILAHEYDEVDHDVVWRIVTDHVPVLVGQLRALLPPPPTGGDDP